MKALLFSALVLGAVVCTVSAGQPTFRERPAAGAAAAAFPGAPAAAPRAPRQPPPTSAEVEVEFWQSVASSTNPADFEAYLSQFPNGVFRALAEARLAVLRGPGNVSRPSADPARRRRAGDVFRDCGECPEMVVLPGGGPALGRYEVTVGEYRAFVSATGGTGNDEWRDVWFQQTDRHPVVSVSWDDAQAYLSWLSRRTGATYRLPTEAEWERASAGSQPGCDELGRGTELYGTCPVGTNGTNSAGLSDMVGNVREWTSDCASADYCGSRAARGGSWLDDAGDLGPGRRRSFSPDFRNANIGFRVALD